MESKKQYTPPTCKVMVIKNQQELLSSSNENPYWQDNQPDPDDWWK